MPTRVGYNMAIVRGAGECAYGAAAALPDDSPLGAIAHRCTRSTDGLYVYLPFGIRDEWLRVPVCPGHIRVLWRNFGEPRGEPEWVPDARMHDAE